MNTNRITILLLAACLATIVSGCGGNAGEAKGYMEDGDAIVVKMSGQTPEFKKELESLFKGAFAGSGLEPAEFEESAGAVKETAGSLEAQGDRARASYARIRKLSGVKDYGDYADLMIQALDLNEKGLKDLDAFLDESIKQVNAPSFDAIGLANGIETFSKQASEISTALQKLQKQAADLKKEKEL
jgi:uncharacterized protein YukE